MASYFRNLPELDYVSRLPNAQISDYVRVKNLFKRGKIRDDIFKNISFFERYKIKGDDRPDNVAFELYQDSTLDWVVLLANNVLNIQTEWPLTQDEFDQYLYKKYSNVNSVFTYYNPEGLDISQIPQPDYEKTTQVIFSGIHHYETKEVKNRQGVTIVPAGMQVPEDYTLTYYDESIGAYNIESDVTVPVTVYQYEESLENAKRNIFVLKADYLGIILNDMKEIMAYKEGSTQYVDRTLAKGDNIRLYQ